MIIIVENVLPYYSHADLFVLNIVKQNWFFDLRNKIEETLNETKLTKTCIIINQ